MPTKHRDVAIIGLGTFGTALARELTRMGDRVTGIDIAEKPVQLICEELESTLEADARDLKALQQCGIEKYDTVIVSIGENIEASILAAMNVMELGCQKVWVKAQTQTQEKILKAIGVHHVVLPEESFGTRMAHMVHNPYIKDFLNLGDGYYVVQIDVTHVMVGKTIKDLKGLRKHKIQCIGIEEDGLMKRPEELDRAFENHDTLLLHGKRTDLRHFTDDL